MSTQLTVGGKPFRCECGCNVFTLKDRVYSCNACKSTYEDPDNPKIVSTVVGEVVSFAVICPPFKSPKCPCGADSHCHAGHVNRTTTEVYSIRCVQDNCWKGPWCHDKEAAVFEWSRLGGS